jgi:hypothetical protein
MLTITNTTFDAYVPPEEEVIFKPVFVADKGKNVSAYINSIDQFGRMEIMINSTMFTSLNFSMLNESTLDIYVMPSPDMQLSNAYNLSQYNLTWSLASY